MEVAVLHSAGVDPEQELLADHDVFVVRELLSAAECQAFIEEVEAEGFEDAPLSTSQGAVRDESVRNNTRVMRDREDWAEALWERVAGLDLPWCEGREPLALNERFRFYRYDPGQFFAPHYDGFFRRAGQMSFYTVMVYLNDDFSGGETAFEMLDIDVVPEVGMGLLFFHDLLHEGRPVEAGRKYVLRTDLMYAD
ncbi:MAG: prolyl 4-hydroxylase [Myxococcota bacterium]